MNKYLVDLLYEFRGEAELSRQIEITASNDKEAECLAQAQCKPWEWVDFVCRIEKGN